MLCVGPEVEASGRKKSERRGRKERGDGRRERPAVQ